MYMCVYIYIYIFDICIHIYLYMFTYTGGVQRQRRLAHCAARGAPKRSDPNRAHSTLLSEQSGITGPTFGL